MDGCDSKQKFRQVETPRPPQIPAGGDGRSRTVRAAEPKRSKSAERNPPTLSSTPVKDSSVDIQLSSGKVLSTMRSLSVSLQSDGTCVRVSKKEKAVHKQVGTSTVARKSTSEKKRNNVADTGGKGSLTRSMDLIDKMARSSIPRRMSLDGMLKPLRKTATDAARLPSVDDRVKIGLRSIDDNHLRVSRPKKLESPARQSTCRGITPTPAGQSTSKRGISPAPARRSVSRRWLSPASRGASPTPSTSPSSASVLNFVADFRNGKKSASNIEDAHQLRLLHNRYMQWQFANARASAVLHTKKQIVERTLYNVWNNTLALRETVTLKRISLQWLRLEHKLNSLLNGQIAFLDDWGLLERDHIGALSGAVQGLKAGTLRLPVTRGARVDTESLKLAVCSAVDVMQTMGSSIRSLLSQVEMLNSMVSELASVAFQESEMLDQCEALLASTTVMQVEEYSLRTHLIQTSLSVEKPLAVLDYSLPS